MATDFIFIATPFLITCFTLATLQLLNKLYWVKPWGPDPSSWRYFLIVSFLGMLGNPIGAATFVLGLIYLCGETPKIDWIAVVGPLILIISILLPWLEGPGDLYYPLYSFDFVVVAVDELGYSLVYAFVILIFAIALSLLGAVLWVGKLKRILIGIAAFLSFISPWNFFSVASSNEMSKFISLGAFLPLISSVLLAAVVLKYRKKQ